MAVASCISACVETSLSKRASVSARFCTLDPLACHWACFTISRYDEFLQALGRYLRRGCTREEIFGWIQTEERQLSRDDSTPVLPTRRPRRETELLRFRIEVHP